MILPLMLLLLLLLITLSLTGHDPPGLHVNVYFYFKLQRALVRNPANGNLEKTDLRITKKYVFVQTIASHIWFKANE